MLSKNEVLGQSKAAFRQWGDLWAKNAAINGEKYKNDKKSYKDFLYTGTGKTIACVGLAPSFEKSVSLLKQYRDNIDIAVVDKALGSCIDNGIIPNMVFIMDSITDYERWCEPWIDKTENIILISNITANPIWAQNWKGPVYFTTNKDNIQTEQIHGKISGCWDIIPASSNVGNSIVVFVTQLMNYDEYLLVGFDFVFTPDMNYYAFQDMDKRYWMRHGVVIDNYGRYAYITQNLLFTCRWLDDFYIAELRPRGFRIVNCSGGTILANVPCANLERKLKHIKKRQFNDQEKQLVMKSHLQEEVIQASPEAGKILQDTLVEKKFIGEVIVRYYKQDFIQWMNERTA